MTYPTRPTSMAPLACQWEGVSGCRPLAQSSRQLRGDLRSVKKVSGMGTSENEMSLPVLQVALLWCVLRSLIVH